MNSLDWSEHILTAKKALATAEAAATLRKWDLAVIEGNRAKEAVRALCAVIREQWREAQAEIEREKT